MTQVPQQDRKAELKPSQLRLQSLQGKFHILRLQKELFLSETGMPLVLEHQAVH